MTRVVLEILLAVLAMLLLEKWAILSHLEKESFANIASSSEYHDFCPLTTNWY